MSTEFLVEISFCLIGLDDESFPAHAVDTFSFHILFPHAGLERLVIFLLLLAKQFRLALQVLVHTGCRQACSAEMWDGIRAEPRILQNIWIAFVNQPDIIIPKFHFNFQIILQKTYRGIQIVKVKILPIRFAIAIFLF